MNLKLTINKKNWGMIRNISFEDSCYNIQINIYSKEHSELIY